MIMDPIHWHPILVHFSFALLFLAPFFMAAGVFASAKNWGMASLTTGRGMLWTGVLISILTVGAGFVAMWNVHAEGAHKHIHDHRNWALGTAALFAALAIWSFISWKRKAVEGKLFLLLMFIGAGALAITGNKGGELVFYHGVAVKTDMQQSSGSGGHENSSAGQSQHGDSGHSH